jgi:hypothetical protein
MKLSEAIRLGAMMKPQAYHSGAWDGKSCALRAAADALGIPDLQCARSGPQVLNYYELQQRWPRLAEQADCPACCCRHGSLLSVVFHLNDSYRWTREQIADWVEQIEQQHEAPIKQQSETVR